METEVRWEDEVSGEEERTKKKFRFGSWSFLLGRGGEGDEGEAGLLGVSLDELAAGAGSILGEGERKGEGGG